MDFSPCHVKEIHRSVIRAQFHRLRQSASHGNYPFLMSATGLALLAVILHIWFGMHAGLILNGDMLEYHAIARHLMEQGYFGIGKRPGAYVTPAYPLFITLIYLLIHWSTQQSIAHCLTMTRQVYLIQQIVDLSIPWLCYRLAREFGGRWVGLAGCALSIAYLPNNFVGCKLLTEALYVPLLLASLLLLTKLRKRWSFSLALGAGAVVGLTILTRPLSAVILPVWIACIVVEEYKYPFSRPARTWRTALTVVASVTIVLCPWWIRNEATLHRLVLLSTEGGNPLLLGTSPYFELGQYPLMTLAKSAHESLMAFSLHYILHGFRQRFWLYLGWYTVGRLPYYFLSPWLLGWWSNTLVFVYFHRLVVLLGLSATGYCMFVPKLRLIGSIVVALILSQWPFQPIARYAYPTIVVWCALIPVMGASIARKHQGKDR